MLIAKTVDQVRQFVKAARRQGRSVGLVPTMGYLHEGHASLVTRARSECDCVVVSVFVNPTQFGPTEDLEAYPRDLKRDAALLESLGVDVLFHPEPSEMYLPGAATWVSVEGLTEGLCGRTRPTHFRGVCTVVSKLMNIVTPDRAYFGQKDAQQLAVIRRMVRDLNMDVEVIGCPIVRETDGLAKSSRNTYLSADERRSALVLSRAVFAGEKLVREGERDADAVVRAMRGVIEAEPAARIDYVEAVDADAVTPVTRIEGRVLFAMAVYIGKTRLIDNFIAQI
ncbi:MAG: pantoate--beta-alanine ligase [Duodenibacillus sp.]|nr:pantoate--beta-alanine ligase [Duodenibacillus sp.]